MMTAQEAIDYIENYTWSTTRLGLERTRELLELLGNPQKKLKFIHVTGSNGKGSTCSMLANILKASGYKVGLYTSPYIQVFNERIQLSGENIPGDKLSALTERVKGVADAMEDHPSQFELVTAIGMLYFADEGADIVVLEVGMGGALDSTNVIDAPEIAIVTNVGLEHTEYLGDTLEKIAETKSGIIKPGCSCVCYDGAPEVTAVVKRVCEEKAVPFYFADFKKLTPKQESLEGQCFEWQGESYKLALLGAHQLCNAAVVLETVEALRFRGWNIPASAVREGLETVKWPARLEVVGTNPLFILDGGHNPQCAEALASSLKNILGGKKAVFLLGVLADKDYPQMMDIVSPYAKEFFCLTPVSDRALTGKELAAFLTEKGFMATAVSQSDAKSHDVTPEMEEDIRKGLALAKAAAGENGIIVSFGSLYLVGHIRNIVQGA